MEVWYKNVTYAHEIVFLDGMPNTVMQHALSSQAMRTQNDPNHSISPCCHAERDSGEVVHGAPQEMTTGCDQSASNRLDLTSVFTHLPLVPAVLQVNQVQPAGCIDVSLPRQCRRTERNIEISAIQSEFVPAEIAHA